MFRDVTPLLGVVLFSDGTNSADFYRETCTPLIDTISSVVGTASPTWNHRDFNPELATIFVIGACVALAFEHHFAGRTVDPSDVGRQLTDLLFLGLRPGSEPPARGPERPAGTTPGLDT
jgi:hypothetical protein